MGKREDFLSFDQLIDEESMDFFQSDEYLMMSKHLNPSLSEGKVSFQVFTFVPRIWTAQSNWTSLWFGQPASTSNFRALGRYENLEGGSIKKMYCPSFLKRLPQTSHSLDAVNEKMIHIFQERNAVKQEKVLP